MDIWYELAVREQIGDVNGKVNEMLREAEEASLVPADDPDEEGE
jgi:hypothetical protein